MMSHLLTLSVFFLISGIGGGLIRDCTSVLIQDGFELFVIVYRYGLGGLYMMSQVVTLQSALHILYVYFFFKVGVV